MQTSTCIQEVSEKRVFQRLPLTAIPVHYDIAIKPNFTDFTFEGSEKIKINVTECCSEIKLNAAELKVTKAVWYHDSDSNRSPLVAEKFFIDESSEILAVTFNPPLEPGKGTLELVFDGSINEKLKGFYRSKFKGPDGQDTFNGITQFAATDARRCFPCLDEPAHKATFDITLIVEKGKVVLSNMPVKEVADYKEDGSLQVTKFERSPIMSTYLVAFVIGDFEYVEDNSADGVLCRVYTPPGKKEQGRFALDVIVKVLPYYKEYFGIAYPLPKLDLVAVADFSYAAMENWGLITFREYYLLIDEEDSCFTRRQKVALTVGHETAHQWFGNLVTMEWWTHLWLNEGYASFVEFLCVDHLFPDYDIWTQFVTNTSNRALELDCLQNSHPIEVPVGHPSEISEIFDAISYCKGSSIIRMLHRYIGDKDFRAGMHIYLKRHQYRNTHTEDLWKALEEASGKPVGQVMDTWTKQMGYPSIRVQSKQSGDERLMTLTQEKYWADPNFKKSESHSSYHWMIPVSFCSASNPKGSIGETLMKDKTTTIALKGIERDEWVKINPGVIGFYRVRYSPKLLVEFVPAIRDKTMTPLDRLGLLDDLFAMVQCGDSSTVEVLKFLEAFRHEDNFTVWSSISNIMQKLNILLEYTDCHEQFQSYGRYLFSLIEDKVGWDANPSENHLDTMLRSLVLLNMSSYGHKKTLYEAKKRFDSYVSGDQNIAADLRTAVYQAVVKAGGGETFDVLAKMYRDSDSNEEINRIGTSFGASTNTEILKRALDFSISEDVRIHDCVFIIISISMNKDGRDLAWKFFKDNKQLFRERFPSGTLIRRLVKNVIKNFVTEDIAKDATEFFSQNPFPGTERTVQQAVEGIRLNESWLKRDQKLVTEFLSNFNE